MEKIFMKLTTQQLKRIIKEELQSVLETQKSMGLNQRYSPDDLIVRVKEFIETYTSADEGTRQELEEEGRFLLKMLENAVRNVVKHREDDLYDDDYNLIAHATTPEETAEMKAIQANLKDVRNDLAIAMDLRWKYRRDTSRSDAMRDADPTGKLQKAGAQPSDISQRYADTLTPTNFDMRGIKRRYLK